MGHHAAKATFAILTAVGLGLTGVFVVMETARADPVPVLLSDLLAENVFNGGTSLDPCPGAAGLRSYEVVALRVPASYNHWGDFDPQGRIFVLLENVVPLIAQVSGELTKAGMTSVAAAMTALGPAITEGTQADIVNATNELQNAINAMLANPDPLFGRLDASPLVQPFVVRANLGECVELRLLNALTEGVSMHAHALQTRPGQGTILGTQLPDITVPGEVRSYVFYLPPLPGIEGAHFLHSHVDDRFQTKHGLFGAIVAEPVGATWLSPAGLPMNSGWEAMIVQPAGADFREHITIYHDEVELVNHSLRPLPQISPFGEYGPSTKGINLRTEPFMNRLLHADKLHEAGVIAESHDKSQAYGSYTNGDPAHFIPKGYVGDPTKFRLLNAGPGQHHVHHLHGGGDRWRHSPVSDDTMFDDGLVKVNPVLQSASERQDVQNVGPGESFNLEIEGGAGGVQQTVGDLLFHCHIVEHYVAGMWSFWRVYNTKQPGLAELPDRIGGRRAAVTSVGLIGTVLPDGKVLNMGNVKAWIEAQLPPPGVAGPNDASTWDWTMQNTVAGPLYFGEPETTIEWPNYKSPTPGQRPVLMFDPTNGRLAYPFLQPHFGKRPPFAPEHGPTAYLNPDVKARYPDGLCPGPARKISYNIVAINADVPYKPGVDVDPDGQVFVHAHDKQAVENGTGPAKSLVIRANQGDCVDVLFTSALEEQKSKVNMHIHLVQFDIQASDGVIVGFNYEQSVRPADASGTTVVSVLPSITDLTTGTLLGQLQVADASRLRVGTVIGVGLTRTNAETRTIRAIAGNIVTLSSPLTQTHASGEIVSTEFVKYRWYPDVNLGIVYWHDHVDGLNSWRHGLFASLIVEPKGSQWCDPKRTAAERNVCADQLDGHVLDIVVKDDPAKSFREYVFQFQDRGCLAEVNCSAADTENPRPADVKTEPASFNLRAEPLHRRNAEYPLASWADAPGTTSDQGDPATDLLEAYPGDAVVTRLVYAGQGSTSGVGTFAMAGHRFQFEQNNPGSRVIDSISFGEASMHNFKLQCGAGGCAKQAGDYLYYITQPEMLERGAWGLMRVHADVQPGGLQTLPNNLNPSVGAFPVGPVRTYDVTAIDQTVRLNNLFGIEADLRMLIPNADLSAVSSGLLRPTPLVVRALPGETVEINVTNGLAAGRVNLHAGLLLSASGDGLNLPVGNNADSTIGPNESRVYRFHADTEVGTAYLTSFADPLRDALRGLFGAIIVEPAGSTFAPAVGPSSTLTLADGATAREHALLYSDNDAQFQASTMPYLVDVRGFPSVNYRSEPLHNRVGGRVDLDGDTRLGGLGLHICQIDNFTCNLEANTGERLVKTEVRNPANPFALAGAPPETPVIDAIRGQPLVLRVVGGAGQQVQVHSVDGHFWAADPDMANCRTNLAACKSNLVGASSLGPRDVINAWIPNPGAGGTGDYQWGNHRDAFREGGAWGVLRVCNAAPDPNDPLGTVSCAANTALEPLWDQVRNDVGGTFQDVLAAVREAAEPVTDLIQGVIDTLRDTIARNLGCNQADSRDFQEVRFLPGSAGTSAVITPLVGAPVPNSFIPRCVAINNGGEVNWFNDDAIAHDPATLRDGNAAATGPSVAAGRCLRSRDQGRPPTGPGANANFSAYFTYNPAPDLDDATLTLRIVFANTTQEHVFTCSSVVFDPAQTNLEHAVIPYRCDIHLNMRGEIFIQA